MIVETVIMNPMLAMGSDLKLEAELIPLIAWCSREERERYTELRLQKLISKKARHFTCATKNPTLGNCAFSLAMVAVRVGNELG